MISFRQNKRYKKFTFLSFASSNSSQVYFEFAILTWTKAQGWSLLKYVRGFPFLMPFRFLLFPFYIFVQQKVWTLWL